MLLLLNCMVEREKKRGEREGKRDRERVTFIVKEGDYLWVSDDPSYCREIRATCQPPKRTTSALHNMRVPVQKSAKDENGRALSPALEIPCTKPTPQCEVYGSMPV